MQGKQKLKRIIRRYLKGRASTDEESFLHTYYCAHDSVRDGLETYSSADLEKIEHRLLSSIERRIERQTEFKIDTFSSERPVVVLPDPEKNKNKPPPRGVALAVAAAIALIFIVTVTVRNQFQVSKFRESYARKGRMKKITLSDGTVVWLNSDSHLKFPTFFGQGSREVYLDGEAYFEVQKDKLHPFLVHTNLLTTRVLGTEFNVKAYKNDEQIEVSLIKGKVMLVASHGMGSDTIFLNPQEKGLYEGKNLLKAGHQPSSRGSLSPVKMKQFTLQKIKDVHIEDAAVWKSGALIFRNAKVAEVIEQLGRRYNITVKAESSLLDRRISLEIKNVSAHLAVLSVCATLRRTYGEMGFNFHLEYLRTGSVYYIQ